MWEEALEPIKADGLMPIQLLTVVKDERLLEAVRQRGSVTDPIRALEGLIRGLNLGLRPFFAEELHRLREMVSLCSLELGEMLA